MKFKGLLLVSLLITISTTALANVEEKWVLFKSYQGINLYLDEKSYYIDERREIDEHPRDGITYFCASIEYTFSKEKLNFMMKTLKFYMADISVYKELNSIYQEICYTSDQKRLVLAELALNKKGEVIQHGNERGWEEITADSLDYPLYVYLRKKALSAH